MPSQKAPSRSASGSLMIAQVRICSQRPAIVAGTLSFLALFVPFLLVPGLTSLLFRELILVIAGIVIISLVVAVSVTPMIAATVLGPRPFGQRKATRFERFFDRVTDGYGWVCLLYTSPSPRD